MDAQCPVIPGAQCTMPTSTHQNHRSYSDHLLLINTPQPPRSSPLLATLLPQPQNTQPLPHAPHMPDKGLPRRRRLALPRQHMRLVHARLVAVLLGPAGRHDGRRHGRVRLRAAAAAGVRRPLAVGAGRDAVGLEGVERRVGVACPRGRGAGFWGGGHGAEEAAAVAEAGAVFGVGGVGLGGGRGRIFFVDRLVVAVDFLLVLLSAAEEAEASASPLAEGDGSDEGGFFGGALGESAARGSGVSVGWQAAEGGWWGPRPSG